MPRFYVKNNEGLWNIYSTIVDNFLFDEFMVFRDLKDWVLKETLEEREKEIDSLLGEHPRLNIMSYEEALEEIEIHRPNHFEGELL